MKLLSVVLVSVCLPGILGVDYYGVAPSYNPPSYPAPSYNPPPYYAPPSYPAPSYQPPYYAPTYYETYDTQVDYKEANNTKHCGILPTVHQPYGYEKDRVAFGQYPWQVAILDNYNIYKCAGGLISPRHVITSTYCVDSMDVYNIRVRLGDYDIQTDKNYYEVYKNYELTVCKKHPYYPIPGSYGYDQYASYPVVILELYADVDFDQYPQVEPVCLPEFYYLSKSYTNEYTSYGYGYGGSPPAASSSSPNPNLRNEEGVDRDLECIVLGYQESPQERISYQSPAPSYSPPAYGSYGQSYAPSYSYESYENSLTPRRAKLRKVETYAPQYSYGYGSAPQVDTWEAEYYFDPCHADLGSPIFCLVEGKYEEDEYYPAYPPSYPETYQPTYSPPPSYSPPSYTPPSYAPPSYSPPQYSPAPYYSPPAYDAPRYKRQMSYNPPSYGYPAPSYPAPSYPAPSYPAPSYPAPSYPAPSYPAPSYPAPSYPAPSYQPSYQPSYSPPVYEDVYKYPIKVAEPLNQEYRRAVLYGVVQYPTTCSYGYGASGNKITSTPVKPILAWIDNIIHTPASCAAYSYSAPAYSYNPTYY